MEIKALGEGDDAAVAAAEHLFDDPIEAEATARFLADPNHHLLLAYDDTRRPVGFVSGVETTHPDKGTEMFLYELGVDEASRRRGIGRALVEALATQARGRGCYGMYVLTDDDNVAALKTYRSAGGTNPSRQVMLEWEFRGDPDEAGTR
jgi:ribosomal protein S18 acetylase RimI-like enzyme